MTGRFIAALLIGAFTFFTAGGVLANEQGWVLNQTTSSMGNLVLYITATGMKSFDPASGVSFFTASPDWHVVMYNERTKNIYETTVSTYSAGVSHKRMRSGLDGAGWKRGRESTIAGLRAYEFVMDKPPRPPVQQGSHDAKAIVGGSYWVAADIAIPAQASALISRVYGVPDCQRVPLRLDVAAGTGPMKTSVNTLRAQRAVIPSFVRPVGYTAVKSDMEVFLDADTRKEMEKLMEPSR